MYVLRNEHGRMIAKFAPNGFDKLFMSNIGEWKFKKFTSGKRRNCFVIKSDGACISSPNGMVVYLWEGNFLHLED